MIRLHGVTVNNCEVDHIFEIKSIEELTKQIPITDFDIKVVNLKIIENKLLLGNFICVPPNTALLL